MNQLISQIDTIKDIAPELEDAYGKLPREQVLLFSNIVNRAINKDFNTSIPQVYMRIPKVLNFDDSQQDPAKTVPQELPKGGTDVDTSKSQWYLEIPKAITAIQWTGNNQQAMEEFCNNGRYRISDNGDGTLRLADSERTTVINKGDYVASLKSGFSIYKADDFVKEYQFIEKNSDAAPAGFEQQSEQPTDVPVEGELPPPPDDAMTATFSIKGLTNLPGKALNKAQSINDKFNRGGWIENMQSDRVAETGRRLVSKLPGQEEFDNLLEKNFGIISKATDAVKTVGNDVIARTGQNVINNVVARASQPKTFDDCCSTLGGIVEIVVKKHQCIPSFDTQQGGNINKEIDDMLGKALSSDLTKTPEKPTEEDIMTEIFGLGDR